MRLVIAILAAAASAACASQPTVIRADFTEREATVVVGYSPNSDIRVGIEDQLVSDLTGRNMIAHASHIDVPDITESSRE